MSEGNIGAHAVLMEIMGNDPGMGFMTVLNLDDMNMRGEQIWEARKLFETPEAFVEAVKKRDPAMVEHVNKTCTDIGGELAVTSGASYKHR